MSDALAAAILVGLTLLDSAMISFAVQSATHGQPETLTTRARVRCLGELQRGGTGVIAWKWSARGLLTVGARVCRRPAIAGSDC